VFQENGGIFDNCLSFFTRIDCSDDNCKVLFRSRHMCTR
jgi:hypothetical protein